MEAKQRAPKGSGNIRKSGKGWLLTVYTGRRLKDGRPERQYKTVHGSRANAQKELRAIQAKLDVGIMPASGHTTRQLLDEWLDSYCRSKVSRRTLDGYRTIVELHLIPALGHVKLRDLRPAMVQAFYGQALEKMNGRTREKLKARTVLRQHRVLSQALRWAVRQGYISVNPASRDYVDCPRDRRYNARTLSQQEVEVLLEAAQGSPYYPLIYTAICTGLRRGELLGLQWRAVDLEGMTISVSAALYKGNGLIELQEPKSEYSRRQVAAPTQLVEFLREYKADRESMYIMCGRLLSQNDLVFADQAGQPLDPSTVSHGFGRIAKMVGLECRLHDLRHTSATLMLEAGVHPKIVQERLGHSSIQITLDTYSHVVPGLQKAAAEQLGALLPPGYVSGSKR